jgi:hypothetical protein
MFKYMLFDCCVFNSLATCVDGVMLVFSEWYSQSFTKERDPLQQYSLWLRFDQGICVFILLDCDKILCFLINVNGFSVALHIVTFIMKPIECVSFALAGIMRL